MIENASLGVIVPFYNEERFLLRKRMTSTGTWVTKTRFLTFGERRTSKELNEMEVLSATVLKVDHKKDQWQATVFPLMKMEVMPQ